MEACAWVLERNGRLPGRDAWAAVGPDSPAKLKLRALPFLGRDKAVAVGRSALGIHCKSITCVHGHIQAQAD